MGFIASVCWPASAFADQEQQLRSIRKRMEDGLALFVAGKSEAAAKQFEAGYAEHPYSAFLYNAGVCYEKLGRTEQALERFKKYVSVDPDAPDIDEVRQRIARLEPVGGAPGDAPQPPPPPTDVDQSNMRSLVVVETEPTGAPVRVFRPTDAAAPAYKLGEANAQWEEIVTTASPTSLSLSVGRYHIVVDKFQDFNPSDTQLTVSPGHVHHFKANLSQGVFMAFLRVTSNVKGAHIWLDTPNTQPEWGTTPYAELVPVGEHQILIEVPGFKSASTKVTLESGERRELQIALTRVDYGKLHVEAMDAPEVEIFLDGERKGRWFKGAPPLEIQAPAGRHQLMVQGKKLKRFEGTVEVPRGQILPLHVRMIPKYPRGTAWGQSVISGILFGGAIYFGKESNRLYDDLQEDRSAGSLVGNDERITRGKWYAVGADAGFAAGTLVAALATWNFIKDPLPDSSVSEDPAVEFEDPLKRRPTTSLERAPDESLAQQHTRVLRLRAPSLAVTEREPASGGRSLPLNLAPISVPPVNGRGVVGLGLSGEF